MFDAGVSEPKALVRASREDEDSQGCEKSGSARKAARSAAVNPPGDDTARDAAADKGRLCAGSTLGMEASSDASYARWTSVGMGDPMSVEAAAMRLAMMTLEGDSGTASA